MSSDRDRQNPVAAAPVDRYARARNRMVETLIDRGIRDEKVLDVMRRIPRHEFVPEPFTDKAYGDHALAIGSEQTISQPYMVALMTSLCELTPESRVLEIGSGSGYQTAVAAALARYVYGIERIADLAREAMNRLRKLKITNATIKCFDGTIGWSEHAPYDAIIVAAGGPVVPEPLVKQLGVGGRLVVPVGTEKSQTLIRVTRTERGTVEEDFGGCIFVKLIGRYGFEK
ncbi:MAG: protein-L-isoaspartate(D-aspartate) O-methyltransferase [Blastocatellia bacterium]|nr:protein-L-isoaspartate(D-aspartate) O-methyltransferase [Blastocatellia bacterium]MBK6425005.1 protein-L-isoaspartate(D-aspartate) O-methyltransferase [Blastocatellia bacterium]